MCLPWFLTRFTTPSPRAMFEITTAQVLRFSATEAIAGMLKKYSTNMMNVMIIGMAAMISLLLSRSDISSHPQ